MAESDPNQCSADDESELDEQSLKQRVSALLSCRAIGPDPRSDERGENSENDVGGDWVGAESEHLPDRSRQQVYRRRKERVCRAEHSRVHECDKAAIDHGGTDSEISKFHWR